VVMLGGVGGTGALVAGYVVLYVAYGLVWGSNVASVNASIQPRLRDTAFAIMNLLMMASVFIVGSVHNRMVAAGLSFRTVFMVCGSIGAIGGVMLLAYSFSRHFARSRPMAAREQEG